MAFYAGMEDYYRLGFQRKMNHEQDRREVWRFIRDQLKRASDDPEYFFPFGSYLGRYIHGIGNFKTSEKDLIREEALDLFSKIAGDMKALLLKTKNGDTIHAVLRGLIRGMPSLTLKSDNPRTASLEMVDLWLIMYGFLKNRSNYDDSFTRLVIRGFFRWKSGRFPSTLTAETAFAPFILGLNEPEREPYPEVVKLRELLARHTDDSGATLHLLFQTTPEWTENESYLWERLCRVLEDKRGELKVLLKQRCRNIPAEILSEEQADGLWDLILKNTGCIF